MAFVSVKDIIRSFGFKTGTQGDRLAILDHVWEKEAGHYSKYWKLEGVKKGVLYVRTSSPVAAQELQLRGPSMLRALNKYFKNDWIKAIKPAR